jgi:hypothetical protein
VEGRKRPRSLFVAVSLAGGALGAEPREAELLGAQHPGLGTAFAREPRPLRQLERMPVRQTTGATQPFENGPFDDGPFDNVMKSPQYSRDLRGVRFARGAICEDAA